MRSKRLILLWLILLHGVLAPRAWSSPYGIFITSAAVMDAGDIKTLSADIDYRFNPSAINALEEGIPLTLLISLKIRDPQRLWFQQPIVEDQRHIQLRYQPLAKSFQVADLGSGAVQNFASLATVLDTLSRLRGWKFMGQYALEKNKTYEAMLRFKLDMVRSPENVSGLGRVPRLIRPPKSRLPVISSCLGRIAISSPANPRVTNGACARDRLISL